MIEKTAQVKSAEEFSQFLDTIDQRIEALSIRRGKAHFNRLCGEEHEDMEELNRLISAILLDPLNREIVYTWEPIVIEPRLRRRAQIVKDAFLSAQVDNDPDLFRLAESIEQKLVAFQPELDGVKMSRNELGRILESEPDRERRKKAFYAGKALGELVESDVVALFQERNRLAQKLGYNDYVALGLKLQDLDEHELRALFQQVKETTETVWKKAVATGARELGVSAMLGWDMSYYLHSIVPSPPVARFPKSGIIPSFKAVFQECGGDFDALPVRVVERDIPYGGLCMPIEFGKDIRILANPHDGIQWYDALFHEFGHGIHSSYIDASSYLVAGGDPAFFWEGIAGIFERLAHEPSFLAGTFGLAAPEIEQMQSVTRLQRIAWFRRIAVTCLLEWAIYRGESQPQKLQAELIEEYMGYKTSADAGWAGNTLFTTHPLYSQNYLLMEVMALQTIQTIKERWQTFPNPRVFEFVRDFYIRPAAWIPWREKIVAATGKQLTAEALGAYLSE